MSNSDELDSSEDDHDNTDSEANENSSLEEVDLETECTGFHNNYHEDDNEYDDSVEESDDDEFDDAVDGETDDITLITISMNFCSFYY